MSKVEHKITPHKGGRSSATPRGRLTPQERERLDKALTKSGLSFADWVMAQVEKLEQKGLYNGTN